MEQEINFEDEIEEVFSGNIYKKIGLKDDPFTIDPKDKIALFVDRIESFNKLLRGIRNMKGGAQQHIAILGSHGIGKTHFIEFSYEILKKNKQKIGIDDIYYIKGIKGFKEIFLQEGLNNSKITKEIKKSKEKRFLIFLDDIDIILKRYPKEVQYFFDLFSGMIIGTWDTHAWGVLKGNNEFKIPKTEAIYLDRLNIKFSIELLKKRIKDVFLDDKANKIFPNFVIEKLALVSDGNPYKLISYSKRYLDFILEDEIKEIDKDKFEKFCDKINIQFIDDIKRKLDSLNDRQKSMIKFIIDHIEVSAQEISNKFDLSRVGAMKNLKILKENKILDSKTKDRTDYYYVPTELIFEISDYLEKLRSEDKLSKES